MQRTSLEVQGCPSWVRRLLLQGKGLATARWTCRAFAHSSSGASRGLLGQEGDCSNELT